MSKKIETSQINQSLNRAVSQLPQPSLQKIIDAPVVKMERMDDITGQEPLKGGWFCRLCSPVQVRRMAAVCGCAVFFLAAGIGGVYSYQNLMVDSIVDMDVNPSFELKINKKDRVLSFVPLNEDAVQAAEGHTYKDWNIEEAVKDLYRIMEEKAYLTDDRKTVLISVENKNPTRVNQLQSQLSACIRKTAEESKRTVHIVTQEKKKDGALDQTALNYHISSGKLQFIRMMTAAYPDLDEMTLSRMSMEELYRIIFEREKEKPVWLQMDEEDWNEYKEEMRKAKYGDRDSSDDIDDDDFDDDDSDDDDSEDNNLDDHESDDRDPADDDFDDRDSDDRNSADHDDLDDADSPGKNVDDDSEDKASDDDNSDSKASDDDNSDSKASDDEDSDGKASDDEDSDGKVSVNNDSEDKAPDDDESGGKASGDDNSEDRDSDNDDSEDEPDD
ncbi:MSCRAMM family adhesin SdrC [Hungatella hathewayi]|uniref:MSCRAMM family adhesin SdrC n=1 Tax=Hungatella hathewayi TaxID=154046 RepID=UPI00210C1083|nr:MSCRAMM family adhesin SdrC [Hungatella hathewayi]MCQ5384327.1 MSCRAMM family adhesin SdrC [Hungatella hathewayi]